MSVLSEKVGVSHSNILKAITAMEKPVAFGSGQADSIRILARIFPVQCDRCESDGKLPGKRKRCKCPRCHSMKRGYTYAGAVYWTGWARGESRFGK